ncbi:TIGR03032 family protein [Methylobacterium iners]|uniref:Conserved hypothetical protein CHP03032 domain-containing protein n=1 Tax=Methylobacterium iners TaxID=418707 RepID=A0ABQ4RS43_9HYPH|nr:TIGR03032 family protein [Methylobacterium iners]GJD93596.1 hypothetical protein OCOJLMKI_0792 [Methylobacterium iners]
MTESLNGAASGQPATPEPPLAITTSRQFVSWLAEAGASLAFTTYQSGKVFLVGTQAGGSKLSVFERSIERPMGLAFDGRRLVLASMIQITTFVDAANGVLTSDGTDAVFVPQVAHYTGDVDAHDVAIDATGRIVFANTLFSCLATVSETHSFRPVWRPPFVSRLAPEDRCHLNGFAMDGQGRPAYATAVAETDLADAWREHRTGGGVVVDVAENRIVCRGLSMPHSPRLHEGVLYVLNSGTGEFGRVDLATARFAPIAFCPGYLRGLSFLGRFAIVGLSEPRGNRTFAGLPLQARLEAERAVPRCALYLIDTQTGDVVHWLRLEGVVSELYDVVALPGIRRPAMIGFKSDEIRRTISVEVT